MGIDHLWQKPYGESGLFNMLYNNNVIFCPFMHSARGDGNDYVMYQDDIPSLRLYHLSKGYKYGTSVTSIRRYISAFKNYKPGKEIYIPRRSLNNSEPSDRGIHVKVTSMPYHGNIAGFYGLLCNVDIIDDNIPIAGGVRPSFVVNKY